APRSFDHPDPAPRRPRAGRVPGDLLAVSGGPAPGRAAAGEGGRPAGGRDQAALRAGGLDAARDREAGPDRPHARLAGRTAPAARRGGPEARTEDQDSVPRAAPL